MWFVNQSNQQYGPIGENELVDLIRTGVVLPDALLWREGLPHWQPVAIALAHRLSMQQPPSTPAFKPASTNAKGWADRTIERTEKSLGSVVLTYSPWAALLSTLADFLKPVVELTRPIAIISLFLVVALWVLSKAAPDRRVRLVAAGRFFSLLAMCSGAWWLLQSATANPDDTGALVAIAPAIRSLQDAVIAPLKDIQSDTKRTAEILETEFKRQKDTEEARAEREAEEIRQAEQDQVAYLKDQITRAGYALDAHGYIAAAADGSTTVSYFDELNIKPTREAAAAALAAQGEQYGSGSLTYKIASDERRNAFLRDLARDLREDAGKLRAAFRLQGAKASVCNPRTVALPVSLSSLAKACANDGLQFAVQYERYFRSAYGLLVESGPEGSVLSFDDYSIDYIEGLNAMAARRLSLKTLAPCTYADGTLEFFNAGGLTGFGSLEDGDAPDITYFKVRRGAFDGFPDIGRCDGYAVIHGHAKQCRARVIVATTCNGSQTTVIKRLSAPN